MSCLRLNFCSHIAATKNTVLSNKHNQPNSTPSHASHIISTNPKIIIPTMSSEDIASQLLHSSDARIAEAAKRVFSSSYLPVASVSRSSSTAPPQFPTYYYSNDAAVDDEGGGDIERKQRSVISSTSASQPLNSGGFHKPTADNGVQNNPDFSSSFELTPSLEMAQELEEEDDRKLSSTERLQRR